MSISSQKSGSPELAVTQPDAVAQPACIRGMLAVVVVTLGLLLPFIDKAFHIDDTLFLRLAEQIRHDPFAPYAFDYNWYHEPEPFWEVTQNPPLNGYVLAATESVVGSSQERALRLVYFPIAALAMVLSYLLAGRFCRDPLVIAALALIAPAFLISATNVSADVLLLVFWLLAIWLTVRAADTGKTWLLMLAGVAAAAAAMTKYFGIALVPLLGVYWIVRAWQLRIQNASPPRVKIISAAVFALPVMVLVAWGVYAKQQVNVFHPLGAAAYSMQLKQDSGVTFIGNVSHVLAFFGGTMLWPICLIPLAVRLPKWLGVLLLVATVFLVWREAGVRDNPTNLMYWAWRDSATFAVMTLGGLFVLAVGAMSCIARRDADSLLLALWLFGTFVFCAFLNWTVSARNVLPCVLPALLLAVRWIETLPTREFWMRWLRWSLAPALVVSLVVAAADSRFANASRNFAQTTVREHLAKGETVYFSGHWGFQYYMEQEGAKAFNYREQKLNPGDLIAFPVNNTANDALDLPDSVISNVDDVTIANPYPVHPMSVRSHSRFYSSLAEPLPFNFPMESYIDRFAIIGYSPDRDPKMPSVTVTLWHPQFFKNKRARLRQ